MERRDTIDDDVEREIRAHIDLRAEELEAAGMDRAAARAEAVRRFGDRERHARAAARAARSGLPGTNARRALEALRMDVRHALRGLLRTPAFAGVAILTLALGIGADTAMFSIVRAVLLRPLPFERPERLVWVAERRPDGGAMAVAWPNVVDWKAEARSFAGIAPFSSGPQLVLGGGRPRRALLSSVGEDFWTVFPVRPHVGRLTLPEEHRFGADPAAVVSHRFWTNELGGRPIDGTTLEALGRSVRVVGVLPPGFDYPDGTDVWGPAELYEPNVYRTSHNWRVVARLADGVPLEVAAEELDALTRKIVQDEAPSEFLAVGASVEPLAEFVVGRSRQPLLLLLGAATFVLLIACTNLASTLLARGASREREMAVRSSLGAGRGRLARQLLTESAVLASLGALAGLALAWTLLRALRTAPPAALPRVGEIRIDAAVLAFTVATAALTTLLCGVLPATRLSTQGSANALRAGGRGSAPGARSGLWRLLVGTEVALALVLLIGSGLLVRSLQRVLSVDAGFDAADVLALQVDLSGVEYPDPADHARFHEELLERLAALPGVAAAGLASSAPLVGYFPNAQIELDGDLEKKAVAGYVIASRGYFGALDVPLLAGRLPDGREDAPGMPHVAVVSRAFADLYWPGEDPIGRQVTGGGMDAFWESRTFATVVGVVGDVRYQDLSREVYPTVYFPYRQRPSRLPYSTHVLVEAAAGAPASLASDVRRVVAELESDAAVELRPLQLAVSSSLSARRFPMLVLGGFAALALVLAVVGIYGVVSYGVARRQRETGIRIALGADVAGVRALVVRESVAMVLVGLLVGAAGAYGLTRVLGAMLYEVSPTDPLTFLSMIAALLAAGWLAAWIPARAGSRVDPMVTMRGE
jgi:predicted permease